MKYDEINTLQLRLGGSLLVGGVVVVSVIRTGAP